ncbi:MAG: hypothetical protein HYX67_05570 [Candidatus Melainabacteria bacterium]|nr:hypothetical protein [Candidatus Melainabacteria bacterium]
MDTARPLSEKIKSLERVITVLFYFEPQSFKAACIHIKTISLNNDSQLFNSLFKDKIIQYLSFGKLDHVRALLDCGMDVNETHCIQNLNRPLLHHACVRRAPLTFISELLDKGANPCQQNDALQTPLHGFIDQLGSDLTACPKDYPAQLLDLLVGRGGRLDSYDAKGHCPLTAAYHHLDKIPFSAPLERMIEDLLRRKGFTFSLARVAPQRGVWKLPIRAGLIETKLLTFTDHKGYGPLNIELKISSHFEEEGEKVTDMNLFFGMDVEIIPKGSVAQLKLNQIEEPVAKACQALFNEIERQKSTIQIESERSFKQTVLLAVKKLLARPAGRSLLFRIAESRLPVFIIKQGQGNGTFRTCNTGYLPWIISLDLVNNTPVKCLNHGLKQPQKSPPYLKLGHEFLHMVIALNSETFYSKLLNTKSDCEGFDDLNEQLVIYGVKGANILCENTLRFEFGELARDGHYPAEESKPKLV